MKKNIRTIWLMLLMTGWIFLAAANEIKADEINWLNYEAGISQARSEGKKVFLHFYADWCGYCKMMNQKTFQNQPVVTYLNENYVTIKVNTDKNKKLAMQYRVRGLPSNWFLQADGKKIANKPGYISPEQMLSFLKFIHTDSYKKMTLKAFLEANGEQ